MQTIWKFPLRITDVQTIALPMGAQILTAQAQGDELQLWAIVDPHELGERRTFRLETTGIPIAIGPARYIATFQLHGGLFVGHLFEVLDA
jgi:hypothetical protein